MTIIPSPDPDEDTAIWEQFLREGEGDLEMARLMGGSIYLPFTTNDNEDKE
jgi:hypothetical protein